MKKFLLFLLTLFIMPVFACAFDLGQNSEVQKQLAQELNTLKQDTCNLYGVVENELLSYYGKKSIKDFYDPEHKTGWFRVYDFLTWLKENETDLTESLSQESNSYNLDKYKEYLEYPLNKYCSLDTPETKGFLGSFLGEKYLLSKYSVEKKTLYKFIPIREIEKSSKSTAYSDTGWWKIDLRNSLENSKVRKAMNLPNEIKIKNSFIYFNTDKLDSVAGFINTSLHETMHLLPVFYSDGYNHHLPEKFSIYAQMAYALPVKKEEGFYSGVRNLYDNIKLSLDNISKEYKDALFSYIQFNKITEKLNQEKDFEDLTRWEMSDRRNAAEYVYNYYGMYNIIDIDFFYNLLDYKDTKEVLKISEVKQDPSYQILYTNGKEVFIKKDSILNIYYKSPTPKRKKVIYYDVREDDDEEEEDIYLIKTIVQARDVDKHIENLRFLIYKGYEPVFKDLANEYIKISLDALYKDYDYEKYLEIQKNPLKYVLKENKDVPPTPKGYI